MGMFDEIRCKYRLEGIDNDAIYQTKCLFCQLDLYEILEDGSLWVEEYDREYEIDGSESTKTNIRWRRVEDFSGSVRFYGKREYIAFWYRGKLLFIGEMFQPWRHEFLLTNKDQP